MKRRRESYTYFKELSYDCDVRNFHGGYAAIKRNEKWGYIDKNGKNIIPCIYSSVGDFFNDAAIVHQKDILEPNNLFYGFDQIIRQNGDTVNVRLSNKRLNDNIYNGIIMIEVDCRHRSSSSGIKTKYGFVNIYGQLITDIIYDKVLYYSEGVAAVCIDGKWGYINENGKLIIPCQYENATQFSEGIAFVTKGEYSYNQQEIAIDKTGKKLFDCKYYGRFFKNGFCLVFDFNKYGFINRDGKLIILCEYENADVFFEGRARVQKDVSGKWGFIDIDGNEIIPFIFDKVGFFNEGFATVELNGKKAYIDLNGNFLNINGII